MDLGFRLKAERERLGLSQTEFAAIAGASKHAQINWEKNAAAPNANALCAWAGRGLDVAYVVTGLSSNAATSQHLPADGPHSISHLPADEQLLLDAYRALDGGARKALLAELLTGSKKPAPRRKKTNDDGIKVSGNGHRVAGRDYHEKE